MDQLLSIENGVIKISNLFLANTSGTVIHTGAYVIFGDTTINGSLTVDTIHANKIIGATAQSSDDVGTWRGDTEADVNGVGMQWAWGQNSAQLIYRTGNRIWTNADLDLSETSSYKIDNTEVLSLTELGATVTKSNLREIGTLESLNVTNDVSIGEFAFFNSTYGRLGLGTEDPSLAIDIVENNVNIVIGSPATNLATIGTSSNHDVGIITDNITRILVKNDGEVVIGDATGKSGVLRVNGSLYVDNLIADTRVDRSSPLQFVGTNSQSIYGLGITWVDKEISKYFILRDSPDRFCSTESIDIDNGKSFYIGGQPALSESALGSNIVNSNLTSVGILNELSVSGDTLLNGNLQVKAGIEADAISLKGVVVNDQGVVSQDAISIKSRESNILFGDTNTIEIGTKTNNKKPIKLFGQVSVNVNNPDPDVQFSVAGDIKVANKRFTNGTSAPEQGSYELGDICWNTAPTVGSYIGWVCVMAGNPGQWAPFGAIV